MSRKATKRGFEYCGETCPDFDKLVQQIKDITTHKLRDALESACQDLIEAEEEIERLKEEIRDKDAEIESLNDHIIELGERVDE